MKNYNVLVGKIDNNGNGDMDIVCGSNNYCSALVLFRSQFDVEVRQYKGWKLRNNEVIKVQLVEQDSDDDEYFEILVEANINSKGEIE